jgi:hypothetical protein
MKKNVKKWFSVFESFVEAGMLHLHQVIMLLDVLFESL